VPATAGTAATPNYEPGRAAIVADNTTFTPGTGAIIAADDVGGVLHQRVKPVFGADGVATDVGPLAGLPTGPAYKLLSATSSAAGVNTILASTEVLGYSWVSVQVNGGVFDVAVQFSNDNTNWYASRLCIPSFNASNAMQNTANFAALFTTPVVGRYLRLVDTHTSGTTTATVVLSTAPVTSLWSSVDTEASSALTPLDNMAQPFTAPVLTFPLVYSGTTWERLRVPTTVRTAAVTATGTTTLWTPAGGKKFRLMRALVLLAGNAATAGGAVLTVELRDGATPVGLTYDVYVPAAGGTTVGGWTPGWVDLGNGVLSAAANNVLGVNLSAALSAGTVRVVVCGTEE
jgi:hypothetical protein